MSASDPNNDKRTLYLDEINVTGVNKWKFRIKLRLKDGDIEENVELAEHAPPWIPSRDCEIPVTGSISISMKAGATIGWIPVGKQETSKEISGQRINEEFLRKSSQRITQGSSNTPNPCFSISESVTFHDHSATMTLKFHPSYTLEATRQALHRVKAAMEDYNQLEASKVMHSMDTALKFGAATSEINPYAKVAFAIAKATFDLLKEQQKYDDKVSNLIYRIERIFPFFKTAEEVSYDETGLLKKVIEKMNNLIVNTAEFAHKYVQQSFLKRLTKSTISPTDRKRIDDLQVKLDNMAVELGRAMEVETLKATKDIDTKLLLERLEPVKAGYDSKRECMEGTRERVIDRIVTWAKKSAGDGDPPQRQGTSSNIFWLYGMPGIGKTSVANSICSRLHTEKRLGGSFFCRRDDPNLGNPDYVLPTLTCRLAETWSPFRKVVAEELSKDPHITPKSTGGELLSRLLKSVKNPPLYPLVLVIDALDECGDDRARGSILRRVSEATFSVSWLKIVITSRQEEDIHRFFRHPDRSGHYLAEDLSIDKESQENIRYFTQKRLSSIMAAKYLGKDWPQEDLVNNIVMRARDLFIFVETLWRLVKDEPNPQKHLTQFLNESSGDALKDLYRLYSSILETRIRKDKAEFKTIMGAILVVAIYRPLCAETIAMLTGREASVVHAWVDTVSSLLYRDEGQNGGIRVRHLSIIDFLTSRNCPEDFRVDIQHAHEEVTSACLHTMIHSLKFNICGLKSSLLLNKEVEDMEKRIKENISDELQYSCMHWSSHLALCPYPAHLNTMRSLEEFFKDIRPLYWIEALSLLGKVPNGISMLRQAALWVKGRGNPVLGDIGDVLRFLLAFRVPIVASTPHIYISGLGFAPGESNLWKEARGSSGKMIRVKKGQMERWPARPITWTGHTSSVDSVAYSPDGRYVVSGSDDKTIRIWDTETGAPVGEPLQGHTGWVYSVAYSPDGRYVVSGSEDKTIRIWDTETGAPVGEPLQGHTGWVYSVAYSPDGRYVVSGSSDNTIRIWDTKTGAPVSEPLQGHTGLVYSMAYSPDGRYVVSGSEDETIRIWDTETRAPVGEPLQGHTSLVYSVAYSPDGRYVVSGSEDKTIRIWDTETGAPVGEPLQGHTGWVYSVAYSPDGRYVVSGSEDKTIRIWDTETGAPVGEPLQGHTNLVYSVAYSPDGRYVVSGSEDKTIRIWDTETGAPVGEPLQGHTGWVYSVAYSPDGRYVVSGSEDKTIRIWDTETGAPVGEPLQGHTGLVYSVAYSPDGRYVVSGSDDKTIRIWDTETGAPVGEPLQGHTSLVYSVAYSPDGRYVVSGSDDKTIRIWDTETRAPVGEPLQGHTSSVSSVAYSPDGRYVVSGSSDNTIRIWDTETGAPVGEPLQGHTDWVRSVAYSPDGRYVVSGSDDKTIRIWDTETGAPVGEPLQGHTSLVYSVAYSPDGRYVVSGSDDKTIRIWDTETRAPVGEPLQGHTSSVSSVAYSPDGRYVVSGSSDNTIRIWDTETGAPVGEPLQGHTDWVRSVAYSPDGRYVVSGSDDKTIRIWDTETGAPVGEPLQGHTDWVRSVAYSPDGRYVVSGSSDNTIRIWDTETGAPVGEPLQGHTNLVYSVAYSPDGRYVVSGSEDKTIRTWDTETGAPVGEPLQGHTGWVYSVAYSPDGRYVVSGSEDKTIRIWDTETGAPVVEPLQGHTSLVYSVAYSPPDGRYVVSGSNDKTVRIWNTRTPLDPRFVDSQPDDNGWVKHPNGGLLFWVPEDCRHGLTCPAVLTIPTDGPNRVVRLDLRDFCFGPSWEQIFKG